MSVAVTPRIPSRASLLIAASKNGFGVPNGSISIKSKPFDSSRNKLASLLCTFAFSLFWLRFCLISFTASVDISLSCSSFIFSSSSRNLMPLIPVPAKGSAICISFLPTELSSKTVISLFNFITGL